MIYSLLEVGFPDVPCFVRATDDDVVFYSSAEFAIFVPHPEGSGVDWIVDDESGIRNVCNGDLESFASTIPGTATIIIPAFHGGSVLIFCNGYVPVLERTGAGKVCLVEPSVEVGSYGIHQSEGLGLPDVWLQSGRIVDVLGYRPNIPKVVRVEYHRA